MYGFIEEIFGIKCKEIKILNPELTPDNCVDKYMVVDIKVKTESGMIINIEMQNSALNKPDQIRFQVYGCEMVAEQKKSGESYLNINEVFQIIFIDTIIKKKLYTVYSMKNEDGDEEENTLIRRAYVSMPFINKTEKYKDLSLLNNLELAVYIFKNGFTDDIMKVDKKVIQIMKRKMDEFNSDDQLRDLAFKRDLMMKKINTEKKEAADEAEIRGEIRGITQGKLKQSYQSVLKLFQRNYPETDTSFLEALTLNQYDQIFDMLLDGEELEAILKVLHQ